MIAAWLQRRRAAKAKARRIGEALRDFARFDAEFRGIFDTDERDHEVRLAAVPPVVLLPDGFTCLRCFENPALPEKVWCEVCAPIVQLLPAEPIERGGLQ